MVHTVSAAGFFDASRVHYIDHIGHNFLFRGNIPIHDSGQSYAYDALVATLEHVALAEAKVAMPKSFELIDVSLLRPFERGEKVLEAFFENNKDIGQLLKWPTFGELLSPSLFPAKIRELLARSIQTWQIDRLSFRVRAVRELLETQGPRPKIIYVHCKAGVDRTGEFMGSYQMWFLNVTYDAAMYENNHITTRDINRVCQHALQWFCLHLSYADAETSPLKGSRASKGSEACGLQWCRACCFGCWGS